MRSQRLLDVSESSSLQTFEQRLLSIAGDMGFGQFSATCTVAQQGGTDLIRTVHNAPPAFAANVTLNGDDAARDPALQQAKRLRTPFMYDQALYVQVGAGDLWEQQAQYGFKNGIAVSLHVPGGRQFMLGFDRDQALPKNSDRLRELLGDLQLTAVYAQDAASRLLEPSAPPQVKPALSARELEVLKWAAAGKSVWETSMLMSTSSHNVTHYMRQIFVKLGVNNKHKAVLNALAHGLIAL